MDQNQFITVYDSLFHNRTTEEFDTQLALLYSRGEENLNITAAPIQQQRGHTDCGPFAVAVCTALAAGENPTLLRWRQDKMRSHLIQCFKTEIISPFPTIQSQSLRTKIVLNSEHKFVIRLWCYCRLPSYSYKFMVECQQCKTWFHKPCIGLADVDTQVKVFNCNSYGN